MRELLKDYDAKVTFFVTQFDSLNKEEIEMLRQLEFEGHEIGSHGAMHVKAENYITNYSYREYLEHEIDASIESMKKSGFEPISFAYPYGSSYWFTDFLIGQKFKIIRNVYPKSISNRVSPDDDFFWRGNGKNIVWALGFDRIGGLNKNQIIRLFEIAAKENLVVILYGHSPNASPKSGSYDFDPSMLKFILATAREKNLRFYRVQDLQQDE